jgi:hypothetical protein
MNTFLRASLDETGRNKLTDDCPKGGGGVVTGEMHTCDGPRSPAPPDNFRLTFFPALPTPLDSYVLSSFKSQNLKIAPRWPLWKLIEALIPLLSEHRRQDAHESSRTLS